MTVELDGSPPLRSLALPLPVEPAQPIEDQPVADWKEGVPLPSEVVAQKTQTFVWDWFKTILSLFTWFFSFWVRLGVHFLLDKLEKKFELALYEDVVLSGNHRYLQGASMNGVLRYMYEFFEKEKEVPQDLLGVLKQAVDWSDRLEVAQNSWTHKTRQAKLKALSEEVSAKIEGLQEGQTVLVPGGLYLSGVRLKEGRCGWLYQVTKRENDLFRFEVLSSEQNLFDEVRIQRDGRERVLTKTAFHSLKKEEIGNRSLWHALFAISLDHKERELSWSDPLLLEENIGTPSMGKLLAPFKNRQEAPPVGLSRDYKLRRDLSRVQTIWAFVHQDERRKGKLARRKLRLHLETLFRYFSATHKNLSAFPIHRAYLKEGIVSISQTVSHLKEAGILREEEVASIEAQFKVIQEAMDHAMSPPSHSMKLSWLHSFSRLILRKGALSGTAPHPLEGDVPRIGEALPPSNIPLLSALRQIDEQPGAAIDLLTIDRPFNESLPQFTNDSILQDLRHSLEYEGQTSIETEDYLVQAVVRLPRFVERQYIRVEELPNNPWRKMPKERRKESFDLLTQIARKMRSLIREHRTSFFDRYEALETIAHHCEYLARLDPEVSNLTWYYRYETFNDRWLAHGFDERSLRARGDPGKEYPLQKRADWGSFKNNQEDAHYPYDAKRGVYPNGRASGNVFPNEEDAFLPRILQPRVPKESSYIAGLREQAEETRELFQKKDGFNLQSGLNWDAFHDRIDDWGIGFQKSYFRTLSLVYSLNESRYTQEKVVDIPRRVLRSEDPPKTLSTGQLKELLLTLEPKTALWNILGLIEKSPELLKESDHRALLELFFIRHSHVANLIQTDSNLVQDLPPFFEKHIKRYWEKKEYLSSLFLVKLAHTLRIYHPPLQALDFKWFLNDKMEGALVEGSLFQEHRHTLVTESLWYLQNKNQLSLKEAREYLKLGFFFEHEPIDRASFDPVIDDEIRRIFRRRAPLLIERLGKREICHVLDEICHVKRMPVSQAEWRQEGTVFTSGDTEIDLYGGMINDRARGNLALPPIVIRSKGFQELFGDLNRRVKPMAKRAFFPGGMSYGFLDLQRTEWRVEVYDDQRIFFYKKEGTEWLQYLPKDDFQYPKELTKPLPPLIQSQAIFASLKRPSEFTTYDRKTREKQFRLHLSSSWFLQKEQKRVVVDDLRVGQEGRKRMNLSSLSILDPPSLHALIGWDQKDHILVWSKGGKIREVEIPSQKLTFKIDDEGLICVSPPFQGFRMEKQPARFGVIGLPVSLILTHAETKVSKLLVPSCNGRYEDLFPSEMLPMTGESFLRFLAPSNKYFWMSVEGSSERLIFDLKEGENFLEKETRPLVLLDLIEYGLHESQVDVGRGHYLVKQTLEHLSRLNLQEEEGHKWVEKIRTISRFASAKSLIVSEPYPETVALCLRTYLTLQEIVPFSIRSEIDSQIAHLGKIHFFLSRKHIDRRARLSREEEALIGKMIKKYDPEFVEKQKEGKIIPVHHQKLFEYPAPQLSMRGVQEGLSAAIIERKPFFREPAFSKSPKRLITCFPEIYEALSDSVDSFKFQEMYYTLKSLPPRASSFTDFMEMLFETKERDRNLVLPKMPPFKLAPNEWDISQEMTRFLTDLETRITQSPEPVRALNEQREPHFDRELLKSDQTLELLEARLKNARPIVREIQRSQGSLGLFASSQIEGYWKEPQELEGLLDQAIRGLKTTVEKTKNDLDRYFTLSKQRFTEVEKLSGLMPEVTRSDLIGALLQKEFSRVARGLRGVNERELQASLIQYLEAKTRLQHAQYVKKEFLAARDEGILDSPPTRMKLNQLLTCPRGYSIQQYPELLVLEDALGFLMNPKQLDIVATLLKNPHAVTQAITGSGKTSVIMVLIGLLKANGANLVTLRFLDSLFAENSHYLQKMLSIVMKRKVTTLVFSTKMAIVCKGESLFKSMYEELLKTILNRGCVITNRKSIPLLEAKFIALLYKRASGSQIEGVEQEHLYYLAKILQLMRDRQECIYDEHDKALYPRDEIHLALGNMIHPPQFAIDTVKEVLFYALQHPRLGLKANTQAELSEKVRSEILGEISMQLADAWAKKSRTTGWKEYFLGHTSMAPDTRWLTAKEQDQAALTKDLLLTYLPVTLSHAAHGKYGLSEDGLNVIPCAYTNTPSEGSQFYNPMERLVYATQYFYQEGISQKWMRGWIEQLIKDGERQMREENLSSLSQTAPSAVFSRYFPGLSLPRSVSDSDLLALVDQVSSDPRRISLFLNLILSEYQIQPIKVSMDAQTEVSMSKASSGISATRGCEEGLHPQFELSQNQGKDQEEMLHLLKGKINGSKFLKYHASQAKEIIGTLYRQKPDAGVFIDGAGALLGISPEEAAEAILRGGRVSRVAYFDRDGKGQKKGNEAALSEETGQYYPNAQSRGADVRLPLSLPAILIASGRQSREVLLQNAGRLRHPAHPLTIAVSEESGLNTLDELLTQAERVQREENSDNLYRSEMAKIRNAARNEVIQSLITAVSSGALEQAIQIFQMYQRHKDCDLLVSEKIEDLATPGSYAKHHRDVQQKNKSPVEALMEQKKRYLNLLAEFELRSVWLEQYDPTPLRLKMPTCVWNNSHLQMGQQCQVEIEQQVAIEQQVEQQIQVVTEPEEEPPFYLKWVRPHDRGAYKIHSLAKVAPFYDKEVQFTENHLPLHRSERREIDKIHHRSPHDRKQNRLHYVGVFSFGYDKNYPLPPSQDHPWFLVAIDILELDQYAWGGLIYDTVLKRFIARTQLPQSLEKNLFLRRLVQLKFEDGQIQKSDYSDTEWAALEAWLREHKNEISSLRHYIETEVLKNRPYDQQMFPDSALAKLMEKIDRSPQRSKPTIGLS